MILAQYSIFIYILKYIVTDIKITDYIFKFLFLDNSSFRWSFVVKSSAIEKYKEMN